MGSERRTARADGSLPRRAPSPRSGVRQQGATQSQWSPVEGDRNTGTRGTGSVPREQFGPEQGLKGWPESWCVMPSGVMALEAAVRAKAKLSQPAWARAGTRSVPTARARTGPTTQYRLDSAVFKGRLPPYREPARSCQSAYCYTTARKMQGKNTRN